MIATSGSVTTATETNAFNWTNRLREQGFSEELVAEAGAFLRSTLALVGSTAPDAQVRYDAFVADFEDAPWFDAACGLAGLRTPLDGPMAERWRRNWNVDPLDS